ncbi:MAG: CvpA family protein [Bacteroidota bacterium]
MEAIDIVLFIPLLWFGIRGLMNGLIIEVASCLALIIAAFFAFRFSGFVVEQLQLHGFAGKSIPVLAVILTFVVVYLAIKLSSKVLDKLASGLSLGLFNKLGGLVFGVLKAAILTGMLLMLIEAYDVKHTFITQKQREKSYLYYPIFRTASFLLPEIKQLAKEVPEKLKEL